MILEFNDQVQARTALNDIEGAFMKQWASSSFAGIVGKNAMSGISDDNAARTIVWDDVHESPEGTFYFSSPRKDKRFENSVYDLSIYSCTERELPEQWIQAEEEPSGLIAALRTFSERLLGVFRA